MERISAHNRDSLLSSLCTIDTAVPPRGKQRRTEHTECWSICRLLSTLAWNNKLEYPCIVEKSERPDYVIRLGENRVGVEFTEAVKEDLARAQVLPEAKLNSVIDISLFKWRDQKKTLEELRKIVMQTKLSGPGWAGDEPEREFADAISDKIEDKTKKLNEETFSRFNEDWLLIYENLSLPALRRDIAASYLCLSLATYWATTSFHKVFVESGEFMVELSKDTLSMHRICNLW